MTLGKWAWVWVVRKDGWMRRLPLALPLYPEMRITEPDERAIIERIKEDDPPASPENLNLCNRIFKLQRIKTNGEHALPWAEPHYYSEV